LKNCFRS